MGIEPLEALIQRALVDSGSGRLGKGARSESGWALLARAFCEITGGQAAACQAIGQATEALFAAADLLDDVEDEDGDSNLWQAYGVGPAVNAGSALVLLAFKRLFEAPVQGAAPERLVAAGRILAAAGFRAARGQHLDLLVGSSEGLTMSQYMRIARLKAGSLVAGACGAGAALGGGDRRARLLAFNLGLHLGTSLQIRNDTRSLKDQGHVKGDWRQRKRTLPILFALRFDQDPRCREFQRLFASAAGDRSVQAGLTALLEQAGAFAFAGAVADEEMRVARERLQQLGRRGFDTSSLERVIDSV